METLLTTDEVNALMQDWFVRDGNTFTKISAEHRLGWEETVADESYSSFLTKGADIDHVVKNVHGLATTYLTAMDTDVRFKVFIRKDSKAFTDGKGVYVPTAVFDDKDLKLGDKIDVFIGYTIHEGAHLLYTDFEEYRKASSKIVANILNILEDERIEMQLGEKLPGYVRFIEKVKYYAFDHLYKPIEPKNLFAKICQTFFNIIRYPKYLSKEDVEFFSPYLLRIKAVLTPYPTSTKETTEAAEKIWLILKEIYEAEKAKELCSKRESKPKKEKPHEEQDESSCSSSSFPHEEDEDEEDSPVTGDGEGESEDEETEDDSTKKGSEEDDETSDEGESKESSEEGADRIDSIPTDEPGEGDDESSDSLTEQELQELEKSLEQDVKSLTDALGDLFKPTSDESVPLKECGMIDTHLPAILSGMYDRIGSKSFLVKEKENMERYLRMKKDVERYIPVMRNAFKFQDKDYKITHKSMRSGHLDAGKIVEAKQHVPTVYERIGEVKSDKIAICFLIDQSGSMLGSSIDAASKAAILMYEALKGNGSIELFIYGHTADKIQMGSSQLHVYHEPGYHKKYTLGSVDSIWENRDGDAIVDAAQRVRKFTKRKCMMFVLSDGEPSANGYRGTIAKAHTKQCVKTAEKMDIEVCQIAINMSYDPKAMFDKYITLTDLSSLAKNINQFVKKQVSKHQKIHIS